MSTSIKISEQHNKPRSSRRTNNMRTAFFPRSHDIALFIRKIYCGYQVLGQLIVLLVALAFTSATTQAADVFTGGAVNPLLMRDIHVVFIEGNRLNDSATNDGQQVGIRYSKFGAGTNIWNNERNQILAGVQAERHDFSRSVNLPDGFATPQQLDSVSASLHYKHITAGDWSLSQSIQYTQGGTDQAAIEVKDSVDLIGLAAHVSEPGVIWMFGYVYLEKDFLDSKFLPVIEYAYAKVHNWSVVVGFPMLGFSYAPHPDWLVGGDGLAVAYKVTEMNILRLSITQNAWAYRLSGADVKGIEYSANRVALDWTSQYLMDHRSGMVFRAMLGWEFNRELGADQKLTLDDAAVFGLEAAFIF